jgi:hypothetical protein
LIDGKHLKGYWTVHAPTQHRTIKESQAFDAKGGSLEVFDKVIEKIVSGQGDHNDEAFIREIEKRTGIAPLLDEEIRSFADRLKSAVRENGRAS